MKHSFRFLRTDIFSTPNLSFDFTSNYNKIFIKKYRQSGVAWDYGLALVCRLFHFLSGCCLSLEFVVVILSFSRKITDMCLLISHYIFVSHPAPVSLSGLYIFSI